ncbi:MAG TPA: hypothetical protein VGF45_20510, partial [Polyangia bacterium]
IGLPGDTMPEGPTAGDACGTPSVAPVAMAACAEEGALGYVRDGNIPFVCARGPANAEKPACRLWRRGSWYLQTRGKNWNSHQVDLGLPCANAGDRSGFPGGTFICAREPKSGALQWALGVDDNLLPYVRWDATETFLTLPCKPPADTSNGGQFYRATLDIDPSRADSSTLYLNIEWIGPFRSTDGGATWAPFNIAGRALPARKTTGAPCHGEYPGFAFVPMNRDRLYFLAGGAPGSQVTTPHLQGGGIWESNDGGAGFRWLGRPELNQYVSTFVRVSDKTLLWGTTNSLGTATGPKPPTPQTKGLVYRSDDGGETWTELPTGLWPESAASFLWVNPQNQQHQILGTFQYLQRLGPGDARAPGLLITQDGGTSWQKLAGVTTTENAVMTENTVISADGKRIFSCGLGPVRGGPCSRSEDGGATFAPSEGLWAVALDPHDATARRMIGYRRAGGTPTIPIPAAILHTVDGGMSWTVKANLPTAEPGALKWDPNIPGRIYLTGDAGAVYRSNDSGATWTQLTKHTDFLNVARTD